MSSPSFILTHHTFVALSSPTRVRILKTLNKRRMTLSEISRELNMSKSAISEHLEKLQEADLVKEERRRRWIYYSLTEMGEQVVNGEEMIVKIIF